MPSPYAHEPSQASTHIAGLGSPVPQCCAAMRDTPSARLLRMAGSVRRCEKGGVDGRVGKGDRVGHMCGTAHERIF
eukprot:160654-Chlamydomonas_euryale.AAC.1